MVSEVVLPTLSANAEEATVTVWHKQEGDRVAKDELLLEVTTDKAAFEIESPADGVVLRVVATPKSIVPTGYILALVGEHTDAVPDVDEKNRKLIDGRKQAVTDAAPTERRAKKKSKGGVRATPAARRAAREQGVDLAAVQKATGADVVTGRVLESYLAARSDGAGEGDET